MFHEHACDERANRYQKSDGSYGGCHEWDYLAHLYICDADNSSICGTEFMRWITTYGREGRWLTDISPYLFMLEDDQERRFRYKGANKGDLTIKFLFSNWGSGERAFDAEFGFTGGQFDGTYNNESRYVRSLNFTVPNETTRVEIVATITGMVSNRTMRIVLSSVTINITTTWIHTTPMNGIQSSIRAQGVKTKSTMESLPINSVHGRFEVQVVALVRMSNKGV